jgi:hypothetical protein
VLTEHVSSETLADEHSVDELVEQRGWALADTERQQQAIHALDGASAAAAPARSVRRATARRASNRRAAARSLHGDSEASIIIDFLAKHPGSSAGDVAKGLNLDPGSVSARLTRFPYSTTLDNIPYVNLPVNLEVLRRQRTRRPSVWTLGALLR